ncbi:Clavaminate synthase-like protein [Cyathus striatus]|nr:Clavaminate synthase-like protein [Cyathus striatus]
MSQTIYPPLPDDVSTHPLFVTDYKLIEAGDEKEIDCLWEAGMKLGFWYMKNYRVDEEVNKMFKVGAEMMALPLKEKMKFEQGDQGKSFRYKAAGANAVVATGHKDTVEFINIAKDDALSYPKIPHCTYPDPAESKMTSVIGPFIKKSLGVNNKLLEVLNDRLGLPASTLLQQHARDKHSSTNPPEARQALGNHTYFGSLSSPHNRLGGLQPIPDHAICNIRDAVLIFSGGILQSNLHHVVFEAPLDANVTAAEWFTRRIRNQHINNRKGPETRLAGHGTEDDPSA